MLLDVVRKVGASRVYCQSEATYEEAQIEKQVASALSTENAQLKTSWSSTLFDIEALPFRLADLPSTHGLFLASQTYQLYFIRLYADLAHLVLGSNSV